MKKSNAQRDSGMALVVSLMIILLLAVLVHRFTFTSRVQVAAAANLRDQFQAECMALSGLEAAMAVLAMDDTEEVDHLGEPWALFRGSPELSLPETEEGGFLVWIQDENSKINLNRIVGKDGTTTDMFIRRQLDRLLSFFGVPSDMRDSLLDCLEDWIDSDDLQKLNGAEDQYYMSLERPYHAANRPLRTVGELYLVKGWQEVLEVKLESGVKITDLLTVNPTGGRINVNTASALVLQSLSPEIDDSTALQVIALREEAPLAGPQLLPPPFRRGGVSTHIQFSGSLFLIQSQGLFRRAVSNAQMVVARGVQQWKVLARRIE
ncbi:MAG: type II secretion system minor pseudopilin GspK [bacterium]